MCRFIMYRLSLSRVVVLGQGEAVAKDRKCRICGKTGVKKGVHPNSDGCSVYLCRGHLKEVMKIRWGHRNSRKLESLHFYGVP